MSENQSPSPPLDPNVVHSRSDWAESSPAAAVVQTVAIAGNSEPTDMPPLYGRIDPDALDAILERGTGLVEDGDITVPFSYDACEVTVTSDGEVIVEPQREPF